MPIKYFLFLISTVLLISGCRSAYSFKEEYTLDNRVKADEGMSVIFGKTCPDGRPIAIKNIETGEEFEVRTHGKYGFDLAESLPTFAAQIPPGQYIVSIIYAEKGPGGFDTYISRHPFMLTVHSNEIQYIGTIYKPWMVLVNNTRKDNLRKKIADECAQSINTNELMPVSYANYARYEDVYGIIKRYSETSPEKIYLFNDFDDAFLRVKQLYPNFMWGSPKTNLLKISEKEYSVPN